MHLHLARSPYLSDAMGSFGAKRPLIGIFWMRVTGICSVAVPVKFIGDRVPPT